HRPYRAGAGRLAPGVRHVRALRRAAGQDRLPRRRADPPAAGVPGARRRGTIATRGGGAMPDRTAPDRTAAADEAFGAALQRMAWPAGNLVFSPASIAAALRMTLCGPRGQTAAEIVTALPLEDPAQAADGLRLLSAALAELPGDGL